jgi:thiol-disulfide isomerase/thioredoxin
MAYVVAALVLVGSVGALNLVLTFGVIKRLREHTALLSGGGPRRQPRMMIEPGESPAEFDATTRDGVPVARADVTGSLVGFFTSTCGPCLERIPQFASYAEASGLPRDSVLAVLVGTPEETAGIAEQLGGVARLVVEPTQGPVGTAFSVIGYPAVCLLDDRGWVRSSGADLSTFPTLVPLAAARG